MPKGREAVIEVLRKYGEINITRLSKETGLHFRTLERVILELAEEGLVEERRYGRLRMIRLRTS